MKLESYILRFGDLAQLRQIGMATLESHGCHSDSEVDAFVIRAGFARAMIDAVPYGKAATMGLKVIKNRLYITGEADGTVFTI